MTKVTAEGKVTCAHNGVNVLLWDGKQAKGGGGGGRWGKRGGGSLKSMVLIL